MEKIFDPERLASCDVLFYTILLARHAGVKSKKSLREIRKLSEKCGVKMSEEEIAEIMEEPYEQLVEHLKTRIMETFNV